MRLFALAALLAAPALSAQPSADPVVLAPGHADLATADLELASGTLDVRLVQPMAADLGTITDTVTHHDDGTVSIRRVIDLEAPGGNGGQQEEAEGRYAWPSLVPVSYTSYDLRDGDAGEVAFDGAHVTGSYGEDGAEPLPFDLTLETAVFGSGAVGVIARAVPLEAGYTATIPLFSPEDRLEEIALTVVGPETLTVGDATVPAVLVEIVSGGRTQQYYVDPATRDLVRMSVAPAPNALIEATPR